MPHRPDSEVSAGQRGPAPRHFVDPSVYPDQPSYGAPVSSYPAANMWGAYPPAHDQGYPPAPPSTMMDSMHSNKRAAHENLEPEEQCKRVKTDAVKSVSVTPQDLSSGLGSLMDSTNNEQQSPGSSRESSSAASESSWSPQAMRQGREPPKKRKKHLDVLRRNRCALPQRRVGETQPSNQDVCQVSPVSPESTGNHERLDDNLATRTPPTVQASHSASYDIREAQALTESAKIGDTAEIGPRAVQAESAQHRAAPRFPEALRAVLSLSDTEGSVLQWLPHGHAWRIVRWDALRRNVLPRYFPELCQEVRAGKNGGSIDAFLWNVWSWGFEEIKDGPDVGAYMHRARLFVRGLPDLSTQMECSVSLPVFYSAQSRPDSHQSDPPRSPGSHTKNLLRVPSLATSRSEGSGENRRPDTPDRYQQWRYHQQEEYLRSTPYYDSYHPGYAWHYAANTHHRHEDPAMHGRRYHHRHQPHQQFSVLRSCPSPYDSRYPFRSHAESNAPPPPSPPAPGIRSGRGGARLGASKVYINQHLHDACNERPSFPVSQRGKGSRAGPRVAPLPRRSTYSPIEADASPNAPTYSPITAVNKAETSLLSPRQGSARTSKKKLLLVGSSALDLTSK